MKQLKKIINKFKLSTVFPIVAILIYCNMNYCNSQSLHSCKIEIIDSAFRHVIENPDFIKDEIKLEDSVLIFFEYGFDDTEVKIVSDKKEEIANKVISTDHSIGLAASFNIGVVKAIGYLLIGDCDPIEICDFKSQFISINKQGNRIIIQFYDHLPYYD